MPSLNDFTLASPQVTPSSNPFTTAGTEATPARKAFALASDGVALAGNDLALAGNDLARAWNGFAPTPKEVAAVKTGVTPAHRDLPRRGDHFPVPAIVLDAT